MSFIPDIPPIQCNPQQNGIGEEAGQIQNWSDVHMDVFLYLTYLPSNVATQDKKYVKYKTL